MLDLNFVRENLPLVEEKLRQRGMDPAVVLRDFREVDTQRRQAITEAETSKAQRNKASEEIAKLKKSGQDASAAMAQTKDLRERIQTLRKPLLIWMPDCAIFWRAFLTCRMRACPSATAPSRMSKCAAGARLPSLSLLPKRTGTWVPNLASSTWNAR